jgi:MFS transporter, CP family, cyanate transporter
VTSDEVEEPALATGRDVWRAAGTLALLWLAGMALRLTLLAIAPLLPLIHRDLGLTEAEIGTLGSLPSLLLAFAAIPGAMLIARFGARPTLVAGLLLTAAGCAARGAAPGVLSLYAATVAMGAGVSIMQPAMPRLVRDWMPDRIGFATAVYSNGLVVAEVVAVALAIPVVLPLAGGSWRLSLVLWAVPIVATAALVVGFAPRGPGTGTAQAGGAARWWPDWRDPMIWRLGFMLGSVNTIYFSANTFLPDYLHGIGRADLVGDVLTGLNGGQLPGSLLMILFAGRLAPHRFTYLAMAALIALSIAGILLSRGTGIVWWAALLGGANAVLLILMLALPALLGAAGDVHRISAAMFTISYPCAVVLPILGGFAWDLTGISALAFAPAAVGTIMFLALAPGLRLPRRQPIHSGDAL